MTKIKYNLNDSVYILGDKEVIKTKVISVSISNDKVSYKLEGVYHNKNEESLFGDFEEIVDFLRQNITEPKKPTEKALSTFNNFKKKINL